MCDNSKSVSTPLPKEEVKIHDTLVLLIHLTTCIEPDTDWPARLISLLRSLDPALIPEMGFPTDWQSRPLWKNLLTAQT